MKLYQQLADDLTVLIRQGALRPGDRVPSVRATSRERGLSPATACWFMTSFQNPLGALVPDDARKELVQLLELHDVPLIEDDVYAELYFGSRRPKSTKAFDQKGLVLNCGSFSKSLAPGYRIFSARREFAHAFGSTTATNGRRRASGPSRPWGPSCDHSSGGGVRLRLSFMG
jgi:DNA-binding transcriptional MocR family regulator